MASECGHNFISFCHNSRVGRQIEEHFARV